MYTKFPLTILYPEELTTMGIWETLGLDVTKPKKAATLPMVLNTLLLTPTLTIRVLLLIRPWVTAKVLLQPLLPTRCKNPCELVIPYCLLIPMKPPLGPILSNLRLDN